MRVLRKGLAALGAVATSSVGALGGFVFMASPASAAPVPMQFSIGQVQLGPLGASVSVRLVFTCDPSLNVAYGDATAIQASGHKLAQGTGTFENTFPGVPCTGASETVTVQVPAFGGFAFKVGKHAIANADLNLFDPVSNKISTTTISGQAITISK